VSILFLLGFGRVVQYPSKFQGECKYPKMMHILHLNYIALFKWTFYHQCEELCNTLIYLNQYVWYDIVIMNKYLKKILLFMVYDIIAK